jgi:hypothetical protein
MDGIENVFNNFSLLQERLYELPSNEKAVHRPTDTRVQQFVYCCAYPLLWERVFRAVA